MTSETGSNNPVFVQYLAEKIKNSDKSQRELASLVGFQNPNMVTMLKQGKVKLALDRVPAMAQALKVDPVELFKIALSQFYAPGDCAALLSIVEQSYSATEKEIIAIVRTASGGAPDLTEDRKRKLVQLFS